MVQSIEYDSRGAISSVQCTDSRNIFENYTYHVARSSLLSLSVFSYIPPEQTIMKEKIEVSDICTMSFCLGDGIEW